MPSKKEKEPIFSAKNKKAFSIPLNENNPITIQVLGICSALAVTSQLIPSLVMGIAVIHAALHQVVKPPFAIEVGIALGHIATQGVDGNLQYQFGGLIRSAYMGCGE